MTLRHMEIFITVCEANSMTKAAKKLFMTQPAVSQAIKELEAFYEAPLFERMHNKLFRTQNGEMLFAYALHITNLMAEAQSLIKKQTSAGPIRVGVNLTVGAAMMSQIVMRFNAIYPSVPVKVIVSNGDRLEKLLHENAIDFALLEEVAADKYQVVEAFFQDRIAIVAKPGFVNQNITLEHLANLPLLLRDEGAGVRVQFDRILKEHHLKVEPLWESTSTLALLHAAIAGIGVAVLPYHICKAQLAQGLLTSIAVEDFQVERKLVITYHKNKFLSETMQALVEAVKEVAQSLDEDF